MNVESDLTTLREQVRAATEVVDRATSFHEAWRPTVFDADLQKRMGVSHATNTFHTIRVALRREMVLSIASLWDGRQSDGVRLHKVRHILRSQPIMDALVRDRSARFGGLNVYDRMHVDMQAQCDEAVALINRYSEGGSHAQVLKDLLDLRNDQIAHHRVDRDPATSREPSRDDIEDLYQDMMRLAGLLMSLVQATAYNLTETANMHRHYARRFWAGARGEKTDGHPDYRPVPPAGLGSV